MKTRFNSFDIVCGVSELQKLVGNRVNQIYDIDNKTFLIRLHGGESKTMLLIESGVRFHTTAFEWQKNMAPSGFSMKLRKHLKNKRLEKFEQVGSDRIVDMQFGIEEAAYHIILELYDRGNIILTDHEFTIIYILRPHHADEDIRLAVREKYQMHSAKNQFDISSKEDLLKILDDAQPGDNLRRILIPVLSCGPAVIDHFLIKHNLSDCVVKQMTIKDTSEVKHAGVKPSKDKKKFFELHSRTFNKNEDIEKLLIVIQEANDMLNKARGTVSKGYIIQKREEKSSVDDSTVNHFYHNIEYHPFLFAQFKDQHVETYPTFMLAVDEFYSSLEGQKIDLKTMQVEREALKKLSNVRKDHEKRLEELSKVQEEDKIKAELITNNQMLVDNAILAVRSAVANQMSWPDIHDLVKAAQSNGDPVASSIAQLKLQINHISLILSDPYKGEDASKLVDVDLSLSAWANARKYYDNKRNAAQKEQKTVDASQKALKSAERKTKQTLKDVRTISTITKARKVFWFEKFYWFISSENFLVIGGRDAQQNELIVKRYMRPCDIYVHAEIQGASSVVIRNPSEGEVPPKTLLEAGSMAISYSVAWEAKVVTNAYWVYCKQVSKTAPTGEYLGTGSFMIRGKKNFLPPCHLIMGLSLLFKVEESFTHRHQNERRVRTCEDEDLQKADVGLGHILDLSTIVEENEQKTPLKILQKNAPNLEEDIKEAESREESEVMSFPDTQVTIDHGSKNNTVHTNVEKHLESVLRKETTETDDTTIIPAIPARIKQQQNSKKRKEGKQKNSTNLQAQLDSKTVEDETKSSSQLKRGQRGKLKKMKSKYKDQDEEERDLRMQILKSAGNALLSAEQHTSIDNDKNIQRQAKSSDLQKPQNAEIDDTEDALGNADVDMLDSLTGLPFEDDEILFAIPVVGPYQALQNYKFKVKLTPGTGKRGHAAKTALAMFSKDKNCTPREKDLLKGIKDEVVARNIPGKVKLSAPQLHKFKK